MGRRRAAVRRDQQLGLRLTAAEAEAVRSAAARAGARPVAWVRQTALAAAGASTPAPTVAERQRIEQLLALQRQVRQAGVCLNQIARRLHAGAPVAGEDIRAALADTRAALDAVLREQTGMILKPISEGRGAASLVAYLTHDQVTADDPRPTTDERVAWIATLGGSPTADVDLCVRMMQGRVADAPLLKDRAGVSVRGRKLRNPYAHFTAAWPPGQAPTRGEQLELADRALSALGLEDHLAVVIAHNDTDHAHWHLVVCKVHPDTGKAASLGRSGLRLSKVAEQWEREHGGIVIDNRVRRRQARERYAESVAGRMSRFKPDRRAATPEAKAAQRAAELDATRRRARDLYPLPPAERSRGPGRRPRTDVEREDWARVYEQERRTNTPPPQTRTERFRQRLQRRLRKAGATRDRARATAERLVPRPRHRHGILRRTWDRLAAAVRRPVDRFAARQELDAKLAAARLERVLGIRRRLRDDIDTALDAILIARRAGAPAAQMDRCYERHKRARLRLDRYERSAEPVVRDHDAAIRREALAREWKHEREREWQRRKRERAEAARGRQQPGRTAEPTPPATAQHRSPPRAAPAPARAAPRPVLGQVPENPATPPSPAQGAGETADRSRGQDRNWRR